MNLFLQLRRAALLCLLAFSSSALAADYELSQSESQIALHVGRSGVFSRLGHEHNVRATLFEGRAILPDQSTAPGEVSLKIDARSLLVSPDGEPPGDAPRVQETMLGPHVLDTEKFPVITLNSNDVRAGPGQTRANLSAVLELHGVARHIEIPVELRRTADTLEATGAFAIKQTDFNIKPISKAGMVAVKDEVAIRFKLVGHAVKR